jgi:drug/metabolite transporter (DMT)-like permease
MRTRFFAWLWHQPYLLLSLTALFWAGNAIVARAIAGEFPPMALSQLRWVFAFAILLPFAWRHVRRDWPMIRRAMGMLMVLSFTGLAAFNALIYTALNYTTAVNSVLMQPVMPLLIAACAFALYRDRLSVAQVAGIAVSLAGVVTIISRGDLHTLTSFSLNIGDVMLLGAFVVYALYSALLKRRPAIHWLSLLAVTFGWGAIMLAPALAIEWVSGARPAATVSSALALVYVVLFSSIFAFICFNRGVELIGPNRAGPFFHLIPLFGTGMAIVFLGERFTVFHAAGAALIFGGIVLASRKSSESGKERVAPPAAGP